MYCVGRLIANEGHVSIQENNIANASSSWGQLKTYDFNKMSIPIRNEDERQCHEQKEKQIN